MRRREKLQSTPAVVDSEGTKLKEECEELNLQKKQFVHEIDMLRSELSVMRQEYVELMEE